MSAITKIPRLHKDIKYRVRYHSGLRMWLVYNPIEIWPDWRDEQHKSKVAATCVAAKLNGLTKMAERARKEMRS
jgi:hypothetical protein